MHSENQVHSPAARSIRDVVFGVNDGLVSITGLVVGVTASHLSSHQIVVSALAAVVAATVAMGLGAYLSTAAENDYFLSERAREMREVRDMPDEERKEVERIFSAQGFTADQVRWLTAHTTADPDRWVDFMMKEELGILWESRDNPWVSALVMALAVVGGSLPPLLPYLLIGSPADAVRWAEGAAVLTAFGLGVVKARATGSPWWKSGGQFVAIIVVSVLVGIVAGHVLGAAV